MQIFDKNACGTNSTIEKVFRNFLSTIDYQCDYFYGDPVNFCNLQDIDIEHDTIILCIGESWPTVVMEKNPTPYKHTDFLIENKLYQMQKMFPDKKFILIHNHCNIEILPIYKKLTNFSFITNNLVFLPYDERVHASKNKNESNTHVLCLMKNLKPVRLLLASYLYGLDLEKYIHIGCHQISNYFDQKLMDLVPWEFDDSTEKSVRDVAELGYDRLRSNPSLILGEDIQHVYNAHDTYSKIVEGNYKIYLQKYYKTSYVEIVTETVYHDLRDLVVISEKWFSTIYGFVFPIFLAAPGYVAILESLGFDTFKDIIDHSYDREKDPALRLHMAIQNNIKLLTNKSLATKLWKKNFQRFENNLDFYKNYFVEQQKQQMYNEFEKAIKSHDQTKQRN